MTRLLVALAILAATPGLAAAQPFALVELFTSQGCSSCPSADRVLSRLHAEARDGRRVFALSFHVDYWNHLGWSDPFSRREFSERQRAYHRALGWRVYTPQMVINGREHFVGSDATRARSAIGRALERTPAATIELQVARGDALGVTATIRGAAAGTLVHFAATEPGLSRRVTRGENQGATLRHDGVVRTLVTHAAAPRVSATLPVSRDAARERLTVVAWLQDPRTLAVLGAAAAR